MKINNTKQTLSYYVLSFLSFLIPFIGFIGLKLVIIAVAMGFAFLTEKYIGDFGLSVGWIFGTFIGGLLFIGLEYLSPYLERLDDYAKTYKKYPYTEKHGENYPNPKPENFGIREDEFKDYNNRFQFEFIKLIFTYCPWIAACIYVLHANLNGYRGIFLISGAAAIAILLNYLFNYWNKRISKRHRHYEKIQKFQKALRIYYKIMDENSN